MKSLRIAFPALTLLSASLTLKAQEPWLNLYYSKGSDYKAYNMNEVSDITFNEEEGTMSVNFAGREPLTVSAGLLDHFTIGHAAPTLYITTNDYTDEIFSKEIYMSGTLRFEGRGLADSFELPMQIRGRGNSTWGYPKKPYRIKFEEKQRMLLPKKAKNFVLLANYIDPSFMRNTAAYLFGEVINMPWINHTYPVDVYFNDLYKGTYQLSEKTGFNNGSIDLKAADEANSILFEFDVNNPDEDEYPFSSAEYDSYNGYYMSVRIKDPDAPADEMARENWLEKWRDDFNSFMETVDSRNTEAIFNACDLETLVRYIMVFDLACNQELNHPKSVFTYKTDGDKYRFAPCWDFDWAFGYQPSYKRGQSNYWTWNGTVYESYENPLLGPAMENEHYSNDGFAGEFFYVLCNNQTFLKRFREVWDDFYANGREEFFRRFDAYAALLEPSAARQALNPSLLQKYQYNPTAVAELRQWLVNRIEFINSDPQMGLWDPEAEFTSER